MIEHHYQHQRLKLNFDHYFECFTDSFSMVSGGFSCQSGVLVDEVVLVDDELSVISMFLSFVL